MNKIYLLLPSYKKTSPIQGAFMDADILLEKFNVNLIFINGKSSEFKTRKNINYFFLEDISSKFFSKYIYLKNIFQNTNEKHVVISYCLIADIYLFLISNFIYSISYIRGNLRTNYKYSFGTIYGFILYLYHKSILKFNHHNFSLSKNHSSILKKNGIENIPIENHLNENVLKEIKIKEPITKKIKHYLYVGSISDLKQTNLLIDLSQELIKKKFHFIFHVYGEGSKRSSFLSLVKDNQLKKYIKVYSYNNISNIYKRHYDLFVSTSMSEGVSRSIMEALFFNVPVIARNVDGNVDLIDDGLNGFKYSKNSELADIFIKSINYKFNTKKLLKNEFTYAIAKKKKLKIISDILMSKNIYLNHKNKNYFIKLIIFFFTLLLLFTLDLRKLKIFSSISINK